ncbi:ABC transporter permease [Chitinophaga sp. GCM10012297]|uniref:Transport permease protein n=1 Tax=Chitinophaga chungangae TaxID=2821488 RepID=A0ABS3YGD1_9BACT|nr:ABC transporter permease [Chitinophaga chungangae]MBO9153731.1 ABC transporter permease [Chitinophaga chungangae]
MAEKYNQGRAMWSITKASIRAMFRSPSAIVFSLGFPLMFTMVFGFIGGGGSTVRVGVDHASDTLNPVFQGMKLNKNIRLVTDATQEQMEDDLSKGRLTAILKINTGGSAPAPPYTVHMKTSTASAPENVSMLINMLNTGINIANDRVHPRPSVARIVPETVPGRVYKRIDFILPGQLGFSLLSAAVFGTAFLFFSLRQTLVLKRFFATPVSRMYIILGEAISRLLFQSFGSIIIIGVGYFFFGFTLVHGLLTFLEMLLLCLFGLIVFMGFGFVVSGIAKTESTIPPFANIVTLPQFLLAGTFFPIDVFPGWLQPICKVLPLTYLNDALRKVAFEGLHLWNLGPQLLILTVWGIVVYTLAVKVFRWE